MFDLGLDQDKDLGLESFLLLPPFSLGFEGLDIDRKFATPKTLSFSHSFSSLSDPR